jgi:predicted transcriptional regulator
MITFRATLNKLQAEYYAYKTTTSAELTALREKLAGLGDVVAVETLTSQVKSVSAERDELNKLVESLKTEKEQLAKAMEEYVAKVDKEAVTKQAIAIVASQGIPAVAVTVDDVQEDAVIATYKSITNLAASRKYYEQNYEKLKNLK